MTDARFEIPPGLLERARAAEAVEAPVVPLCGADVFDVEWEEDRYCARPAGHPDEDGLGGHDYV